MFVGIRSYVTARFFISIFGLVILLAVVAAYFDWSLLLRALSKLSVSSILVCVLANALTQISLALRWAVIVANGKPLESRNLLVALHSYLYNLVTPAALGADLYKIADSSGVRGARRHTVGYVLFERCLGISSQCVCFMVAWAMFRIGFERSSSLVGIYAKDMFNSSAVIFFLMSLSAAAILGITSLIFQLVGSDPRISYLLQALDNAVRGRSALHWPLLVGLSLAAVVGWVTSGWALAVSTGLTLQLSVFTMVTIITEFARLIPFSIQGVGVREATFGWLSASAGASVEIGIAVCASAYLINNVVQMIMGIAAGFLLSVNVSSKGK